MRVRELPWALSFLALICAQCGDDADCDDALFSAVEVIIRPHEGIVVDSVTATQKREESCDLSDSSANADSNDAGEAREDVYYCYEQQPGTYVVRVKSGERTWMQSVRVSGDSCHVYGPGRVTFTLDE